MQRTYISISDTKVTREYFIKICVWYRSTVNVARIFVRQRSRYLHRNISILHSGKLSACLAASAIFSKWDNITEYNARSETFQPLRSICRDIIYVIIFVSLGECGSRYNNNQIVNVRFLDRIIIRYLQLRGRYTVSKLQQWKMHLHILSFGENIVIVEEIV